MAREFTMGIRLNYYDNSFTRGIREANRHTNTFRQGMAAATRSADGFTRSISAAAVALGGIAAARKSFDWLIGANADMETYQNTLTVVLKSQERAVETLAWANKFAAQTPFEIPEIIEATTRLSAYGMEAQKVLGITGDMASVMGKDLMQAVEAIADAQTGELERLKEFGITKGMIEEQAKLLGSTPINNKGQITDMKAFNAALFSLMEDRYKGGMEMQSKTFKGMISNAQDFMGNLGRQLGQPLFERSKKQLQSFLDTLDKLQSDGTIDQWVKQVHRAGAAVGRVFQAAYRVTATAFKGIGAIARPIIDGIKKHWTTWQPIIETLGYSLTAFAVGLGAVKMALTSATIAMRLLNATMLTNPVGWLILGIGLLIGLFIKLNGGLEGTKKVLAGWFNQLKAWYNSDGTQAWVQKVISAYKQMSEKVGQAFSWLTAQAKTYWPTIKSTTITVMNAIGRAFQWIKNQAIKYWPTIQATIKTVFDYAKTNILPILKQLLTVATSAFRQIWAAAKPFGEALYNFFVAIAPSVWGLVKGIAGVIKNVLWPAFTVIWKVIADIAAAVIPVVTKIVTSIIKAFTTVLNWARIIWPAVSTIIGRVFEFIKFVWAAIGPYIMAALQVIGGIISGGFKVIMSIVEFVWTTIKSIITVAWSIISGIIQTAMGILTGDWQMAWDGFKSIFEGVWKGITDFLGGIGKMFYDSGKAIIETLVNGIKSVASAPVEAFKNVVGKIRDFLPFSDAKKGPLSELTYSGGAIMTTLATGVAKKQGALQDAVNGAFSSASLGMDMAAQVTTTAVSVMAPAVGFSNALQAAPRMAPVESFSDTGTSISPTKVNAVAAPPAPSAAAAATTINVGDITINAPEGMDTIALAHEVIDQLYKQMKAAANILSSGNKAAML
nr:tape measure protein [Aneurinibacillus sp. XH2]